MAAERKHEAGILAAEMPLLLFHADGVALGVEAAAVEGILDVGQARDTGVVCRDLAELLGADGASSSPPERKLLLLGRDARHGLGIDSLDEIVTVPTTSLQPLPPPLTYFRGPRTFWGGIVRADKVVLLVDFDRFQEPAPVIGEAL